MKFENYLFGMFINSYAVAKYSDGKKIKLSVHNIDRRITTDSIKFDNEADYDEWIDAIVSDHDAVYDEARALQCVIQAIGGLAKGPQCHQRRKKCCK